MCKEWHSLALPLLYEYLDISRGRTLPKLRDTFKRSCEKARSSDDGHPLGWCTKRLDIAMRDMIEVSMCSGQLELECLSEIIRCLPNLAILTISVTADPFMHITFPPSLLRELVKSSRINLQAIVWRDTLHFKPPCDWYITLAECPKLQTIACTIPLEGTLTLNFPRLETLHVLASDSRPIGPSELSSLRRLIINVSCILPVGLRACLPESHGAKLETIQLEIRSHYVLLPSWLESISTRCPNLSRLDLSFYAWPDVNSFNVRLNLPGSLRILGIQSLKKQSPSSGYNHLLKGLQNMKFGSAHEAIQFTDMGNLLDLQRHPRKLRHVLDTVKGIGLAVKGPDGSLLS